MFAEETYAGGFRCYEMSGTNLFQQNIIKAS